MKRAMAMPLLLVSSVFFLSQPVFAWNSPSSSTPPYAVTDPEYQHPFTNDRVLGKPAVNRLPAMGWNSWNAYGSNINETKIKGIGDSFIRLGLDKVGFKYVVTDDGSYSSSRDASGNLSNNTSNFPKGFKDMSDYMHNLGLKFGMYNDTGTSTCAGQPGIWGHEDQDAQSFANWGIDYLKIDFCSNPWSGGAWDNDQYDYGPNINSVTVSDGAGFSQTVYATDGTLVGDKATKVGSGAAGYVNGIGTITGRTQSATAPYVLDYANPYGELLINVSVPADGNYNMSFSYAATATNSTVTSSYYGRWIQVDANGQRVMDQALPATSSATAFTNSPTVSVALKAGDNTLRFMDYMRYEKALQCYAAFYDSLAKAGKVGPGVAPENEMVYSLCEWGRNCPWNWGYKVGDSWRIWDDIQTSAGTATWAGSYKYNIICEYDRDVVLDEYAGLDKGWNDPDMMCVGLTESGTGAKFSQTSDTSHFTAWCMLNAPLILGNDLNSVQVGDPVWQVITNKDVIGLNQDPLGIQAKRIKTSAGADPSKLYQNDRIDVLAKPLANGDLAIMFFNTDDVANSGTHTSKSISVGMDEIVNLLGSKMVDKGAFAPGSKYIVKDLWTKAVSMNNTGVFDSGTLAPRASLTLRVTPVSKDALAQAIADAQAALQTGLSGAAPLAAVNSALSAAIDSAKLVYNDAAATVDGVQNAIVALSGQTNLFNAAYAAQKSLSDDIAKAQQALTDNTQYLNRVSVRVASVALSAAIASAQAALVSPTSDTAAMQAADAALTAALTAFNKAVAGVFNGYTLKTPWYTLYPNPQNMNVNSANSLTIMSAPGDFYGISPSSARVPNITLIDLLNSAFADTGNVELTCKLTFTPTQNYQTAGILFYQDDYNLVTVTRRFHSGSTPNQCFMSDMNTRASGSTGGASSSENRFADGAYTTPACYLRLVKSGATITGYFRSDETLPWTQASAFTQSNIDSASKLSVGVVTYNGSGSAPSIPAKFEDFRINGVLQPFGQDFVTGLEDAVVQTPVGTAPALPATVTADYSDNSQRQLGVVWDPVDPAKYAAPSAFDVEGSVPDANMYAVARVTVFPSSVSIVAGDKTAAGVFKVVAGDKPVDYLAIMATYDGNGVLTDIKNKPGHLGAGAWTEDSLEVSQTGGYTVKAFLWDSATFSPLAAPAVNAEPAAADKSALSAAIAAADAVVNSGGFNDYTRLSADGLSTALDRAKSVNLDAEATQSMVDAAAANLGAAQGKLRSTIIQLTGSIYGRPGTYSNAYNVSYEKIFDGDVNTFFDSASQNAAWAGIDLGAGNEAYVYSFKYHPRSTFETRMNGCTIRGSNDPAQVSGAVGTVLYTVANCNAFQDYTADSAVKDQAFRYIWIQSGSTWWGNTNELAFYGKPAGADLSLLADRIAYAASLSASGFTPASWANLQAALAPAKALTKASAQSDVDAAAANLKAAIAQLQSA